jgi:hypothetical protein
MSTADEKERKFREKVMCMWVSSDEMRAKYRIVNK